MAIAETTLAALSRHFGFRAFREGQAEVVEALLAGRDALAVMPTGRGKSLCYQLPALMLGGTTLVVSPLIALMNDQVAALRARGVPAAALHSGLAPDEASGVLAGLARGRYALLYVAPERFGSRSFQDALAHADIRLVAIDEAHCISQWGHDFRPDYMHLEQAIASVGRPPVLAATATATPEVRDDVCRRLGLREPQVVVAGFARPNLRWVVRHAPNAERKLAKLAEILERVPGPAIVYAATRKSVETLEGALAARGHRVAAYHAGLTPEARQEAQEAFMADRARVMVATNAFGMGIDKPDIRSVIHADLPGTLEAYYQEAGRAGRDGHAAFVTLLFSPADRHMQEFFIAGSCPSPAQVRAVFDALEAEADPETGEAALSQEAIARRLPMKTHDMAVGTALTILCRVGALRKVPRRPMAATIRLLKPAADATRSGLQTRILSALKRVPGALDGAPVPLSRLAADLGESASVLHHGAQALAEKGWVAYAAPSRAQAYRVLGGPAAWGARLAEAALEGKAERERAKLESLLAWVYAPGCRQSALVTYFGEADPAPCGRCDRCRGQGDPEIDALALEKGVTAARAPRPAAWGRA